MTQYLYIDDEKDVAESFADALEIKGALSIKVEQAGGLEQILGFLSTKPDGLLLDIKLSNTTDEEGKLLRFDGLALAQQLRSLQTRGELQSIPIVRFSQPVVVQEYVRGDSTSDDCFDERISKDEIAAQAAKIGHQLLSLADGYPRLRDFATDVKNEKAAAIALGVEPSFLDRLDSRILADIQQAENAPVHVLAGFFLNMLIGRPGPLITEDLLAARLGVDRQRSQAGWPRVLENLKNARYAGVFHSGYPRWWMAAISDIWEALPGAPGSLARLRAEERVEFLQKSWKMELTPFAENPESPGRRYWAICLRTGLPVDPTSGIALLPRLNHQPWQDAEYLSLEAALRDSHNPRIRPDDKARLQRELNKRGRS